MDVTPGAPAKRSRAKTNGATAEKAAKATTGKKPRARKPRAEARVETLPAASAAGAVTPTPSADELRGMIATAAYYLAAERNFSPGHELDDWLEAERRIHATLFG
ncbi:MAG: DUF2934 domain-containing protein [Xanthomonadaceae bacterium]|nr:DUF2934 domain-containing protein [Xanthomonadaceae bacterium]